MKKQEQNTRALGWTAAMSGFLLIACNAVTGADGILLSDDDFNDTSSGGVGGNVSTGPTTGPSSGGPGSGGPCAAISLSDLCKIKVTFSIL